MRYIVVPMMIAVCGCGEQERRDPAPPAPADAVSPMVPAAPKVSQPAAMIPLPKDQAETDRLILAGYTPHSDHMHAPGVKVCPLVQGGEAVM